MLSTHGAQFTQIELGLTGAGGTGYWVLATLATYPGGWYQCMVDVSKAVDSGTKPTMTSITAFVFRVTLTGGKNVANFWLDNLVHCDGLQASGDDGGGAYDYEDIRVTGISEATGVISLYNGIYYLTGSITVGVAEPGVASSNFVAKNQILVFVDKAAYINASLYAINVRGNSTGATQIFQLGELSGGAGINGCTVVCPNATLAYEFTATDVYVTTFGLYGSTFNTHGTIDTQPNGANLEIIGCTFLNGQGQIQPNTMTFTQNFIIGNIYASGALLLESELHQMEENNYIACTYGIQVTAAGTYPINGDQFSGSVSADINNTSGGLVTINANESNIATYTGNTVILNTVYITITIQDQGGSAIQYARVAVYRDSDDAELMNELTDISGEVTVPYNYGAGPDVPITIRVRKSSSPGIRYIPFETGGAIENDGFSITIRLSEDAVAL